LIPTKFCPLGYERRVTVRLPHLSLVNRPTEMTLSAQKPVTHHRDHEWLAVRVACGTCGGHRFDPVQRNLLECSDCHTRQWQTLNMRQSDESPTQSESVGFLKQLLIHFGYPQRAFIRYIPKATQFFWFRCIKCKKTTTDYLHGYSGYFICQFCKSENLL